MPIVPPATYTRAPSGSEATAQASHSWSRRGRRIQRGERAARRFLDSHFDDLGRRSTIHVTITPETESVS